MTPAVKSGMLGALLLLFGWGGGDRTDAADPAHQVHCSIMLRGHVLLGVGYTYYCHQHQGWQSNVYLIPEKGWPHGIATGCNYIWGGTKWPPNFTADVMILASPPDPVKRKYLAMIRLLPGIQYEFGNDQSMNSRLWIAYFLRQPRPKIVPIGLEVMYGQQ